MPGSLPTGKFDVRTVGLAGEGATVALVLGAASTSPAFAVTRHHDRTVTVWVKRSDGIAGANTKLHQLGIRALSSNGRCYEGLLARLLKRRPSGASLAQDELSAP